MFCARCLLVGIIGLAALASQRADAITLYSNTLPASSGAYFRGPPTVANLDDVQVNNIINLSQQPLAVTQVTFGIMRFPSAGAVDITGWWGTTTTTSDFPSLDAPIHSFGSVSLGAYTGSITSVVPVTIGNGSTTLFTVNPNFTDSPGFGEFAVGLQFSNNDTGNNWALAEYVPVVSPQNLDGAWEYTFATNTSTAYALEDPDTQEPFYTAYYLNIQGNVVPEPASSLAVAAAGLALLVPRRGW